MSLLVAPMLHVEAISRAQLNSLLLRWGHRMGEYTRPSFAFEAHHALFHHGQPVAVAAAGETVREVVGDTGLTRRDAVELVRLCAAREHLCRPMLRLWREFIFPAIGLAHGRRVAVSYQDESLHSGDLYRFDGWVEIGRGGGGGSDQRSGRRGRRLAIWGWPADELMRPDGGGGAVGEQRA